MRYTPRCFSRAERPYDVDMARRPESGSYRVTVALRMLMVSERIFRIDSRALSRSRA